MKITNRLIIAFLIITLIPLLGGTICFHEINKKQNEVLSESYSTDPKYYSDFEFILNPVQILYSLTLNDFNSLTELSENDPDKLNNSYYLRDISTELRKHYSFIAIRKDNEDYFTGDHKFYKKLSPLPDFNKKNTGKNNMITLDQNTAALIRHKDFYFSDHSEGQIFLITDLSELIPRWKSTIFEILRALILIVIITALVLILWLNQSIIKPLNVLRIATNQIGMGNLDDPIHVPSSDEIG